MSGNISTTGSIEDALDNLETSKSTGAKTDSECQNCKKPRSKRKVERKNFKSGTCYGGPTEAVDLVPVCPDCGQIYERIRSKGDHSQKPKNTRHETPISGKFRQSRNGTLHPIENGETVCGYDGGKVVERTIPEQSMCGDCRRERRND